MTVDDLIPKMISQAAKEARGRSVSRRKVLDPSRPAAKWLAKTRIGKSTGTALSIVLGTVGCSHARGEAGGCTMCSYLLDGSSKSPTSDEVVQQFSSAVSDLAGHDSPLSVKIYTSGSFFDEEEVPVEARNRILDIVADNQRVNEIVIESRPEYVSEEVLSGLEERFRSRSVELGIGLESSSDRVRSLCVNKGFAFSDFVAAVTRAGNHGIGVRAYVLLKPPFMTERDAILDAKRTISDAVGTGVTTVSLNPVNVQKDTLVEHLWKQGHYRPPWLWSVVDVLAHARSVADPDVNIICDPVAAGKQRGAHNCGKCDDTVVSAIRRFGLSQDQADLTSQGCRCMGLWHHAKCHENVAHLVYQ